MTDNNWVDYKNVVKDRLKTFALEVLMLSDELPKTTKGKVINYQLTKSGTSAYANYRAALRGRSKREFFAKLCISVEEMDESEMWIDLIKESRLLNSEIMDNLHQESIELVKILSSMRKRMESK